VGLEKHCIFSMKREDSSFIEIPPTNSVQPYPVQKEIHHTNQKH
jgi:hypothetical protein